jgi:alcohol dehydrogenase class IV
MSNLDTSVLDSSSLQGFYSWTDTLKGVYYGPGSVVYALPKLLDTLGVKKALVVTGRSLREKVSFVTGSQQWRSDTPFQTDVVSKVESVLKKCDAFGSTFFEIVEHSPISCIRNGVQKYKENGCECIVSVGGGSPIDASKVILYNIQKEFGGKTPPQIAIPTTLSAAEYTVRLVVKQLPSAHKFYNR